MSNLTQGTAANVIVGPARLLVAPIGSTLPTLDGTVDPITWDAAWKETGYTEDGLSASYNPTIKDIMVDEETSAVKKILDAEKCTLGAKLSESTLANLNFAISASTYAHTAATMSAPEFATLKVGSGALNEVMVGFEGLSPTGKQRIFIAYRAIAQANVALAFKRSDKVVTPVEFGLISDSTKSAGSRLFEFYDRLANHT